MPERNHDNWIKAYLKYVEETEPPTLFHTWCAVSAIAAALQRKCYVNWQKKTTWYPNFYIVLTAPPGKARKGTSMSIAKSFLRDLGIPLASEATTREALIQEIAELSQTDVSESGEMQPHCSITIFSDEFNVFLGHGRQEFMTALTDWFDCPQNWQYRTKSQGTDSISGMWVNLLAATTPDALQSALPDEAIGGGFTSRIIFVFEEEKRKAVPFPWETKEEAELYKTLLEDLEQIHTMMGQFKVTDSFNDVWGPWYKFELEQNPPIDHRLFQGYNSRRQVHTMKLAMVLSAAMSNDMLLEGKHLKMADELLTKTEAKMPRVFLGTGSSRYDKVTARMMSTIAKEGEISLRRLCTIHRRDLEDKRHAAGLVEFLGQIGFCKVSLNGDGVHKIKLNEDHEHAKLFK